MPRWWPGQEPDRTQKQVYDIVKLYGPLSATEAAEKLHEERDKPAGIPFEGKSKHNIVTQTHKILRRLAGMDRVVDVNPGGTRPQWAAKLPEPKSDEPKPVTKKAKRSERYPMTKWDKGVRRRIKQSEQPRRDPIGRPTQRRSTDTPPDAPRASSQDEWLSKFDPLRDRGQPKSGKSGGSAQEEWLAGFDPLRDRGPQDSGGGKSSSGGRIELPPAGSDDNNNDNDGKGQGFFKGW